MYVGIFSGIVREMLPIPHNIVMDLQKCHAYVLFL